MSPKEITALLRAEVGAPEYLEHDEKRYVGEVTEDRFKFRRRARIFKYVGIWPYVKGSLEQTTAGTLVELYFYPQSLSLFAIIAAFSLLTWSEGIGGLPIAIFVSLAAVAICFFPGAIALRRHLLDMIPPGPSGDTWQISASS